MPSKPLTGRVPPDAIRLLSLPRLDPGLLRRYAALEDLSGAVSDALDQLGLQGAVPASALAPTLPGTAHCVDTCAMKKKNPEKTHAGAAR